MTIRGSRPSPGNVDVSKGALLGCAVGLGVTGSDCSIFGLEVNNDDIICVGCREAGACPDGVPVCEAAWASLRGFLMGLSEVSGLRWVVDVSPDGSFRLDTRLAFALQAVQRPQSL